MAALKTFLIGRNPECDIVLADATISRRHAELVEALDGRHYLTDRASAAGTWMREGDEWVRLRQAFVTADQPIMLGRYATTVTALLKLLAQRKATPAPDATATPAELLEGPVMRNPLTGEIVRRER